MKTMHVTATVPFSAEPRLKIRNVPSLGDHTLPFSSPVTFSPRNHKLLQGRHTEAEFWRKEETHCSAATQRNDNNL
jgi:hypothetical protein